MMQVIVIESLVGFVVCKLHPTVSTDMSQLNLFL